MTDYEYNKLKAAYDETMSRTGEGRRVRTGGVSSLWKL